MSEPFRFDNLEAFSVYAQRKLTPGDYPNKTTEPHIHDYCEIYVNISGNVSFVAEKNIYSISPGDIILTKPHEYHHCVYNDQSDHHFYLINFSPNENPAFFSFLLEKEVGESNHIRLSENKAKKFLALCEEISQPDTNRLSYMAAFLKIMAYLEEGMAKYSSTDAAADIPINLKNILDHINNNCSTISTIREVADEFYISLSTIERYFKKYLSMTPKRYLEDKKLQKACILLEQQYKVIDACFESGFTDYSHFISVFKKKFKTTPMKYKNR